MSEIVNVNRDYVLKQIISVFERGEVKQRDYLSPKGDAVTQEFYLESHEVEIIDGKPVAGPGSPLRKETLFALGSFLHRRRNEITRRRGVLPRGLLYMDADQQRYVWMKKSHRSPIMFSKDCQIPDRIITHPTLIFCCHGDSLFIYASTTDDPKEDTQLSRAPYLNIYEEENLCKGNVNLSRIHKAETHQDLINAWEDVFFKSRFSHGLGKKIPNATKLTNAKYIEMIGKAKSFPYKTLQKTNKQLKSLFK